MFLERSNLCQEQHPLKTEKPEIFLLGTGRWSSSARHVLNKSIFDIIFYKLCFFFFVLANSPSLLNTQFFLYLLLKREWFFLCFLDVNFFDQIFVLKCHKFNKIYLDKVFHIYRMLYNLCQICVSYKQQ